VELSSDPARRAVTPLELFFDLVYVFVIGQLSHRRRRSRFPTLAQAMTTDPIWTALADR
jgi:low temperature requirement protein LtrA